MCRWGKKNNFFMCSGARKSLYMSLCIIMKGEKSVVDFRLQGTDRLVGQVVKASTLKADGPEFESCLRQDLSRSSHTIDLKIGTPVATLPDPWRFRVSAGTSLPGVSVL